jgi:phage terminase large subunit|tara:strand:- start:1214 stop:2494 length:1281 start_codon:yes stop_codon:yes gene_type:complete
MKRKLELNIDIKLTEQFTPFLEPKRLKVVYGGRGSGKSWSIAQLLVLKAWQQPTRILCAREIQRSISDSVLQLLNDTIGRMGLEDYFDVQKTQIVGTNGSRFIFEGMRSNITKIKSMEGIDIAWCEEAESITYSSWETLIPTVRKEGSEIWVSFNPNDEMDDTYQRFVENPPPESHIYSCKVNYYNNPFFPPELEKERLILKDKNIDLYNHVWEGEVLSNRDGAYFAKFIQDNQIMDFAVEPNIPVDTYWDLGIADSTAIWLVQQVGREIRVVDCYENQGEGLQFYVNYLHDWRTKHQAVFGQHYAPHDIQVRELGSGKSRLETARKLGIHFRVVPKLSIEDGIHAARAMLPKCYFNKTNCKTGLQALRRYRKEFDERKGVYKPHPLHDWSSHYSDAFRYFSIAFRDRNKQQRVGQPQANIDWLVA